MHEKYSRTGDEFHSGYVQGLRDAGMQGLSQSMQHLATGPRDLGGYSAGYMQAKIIDVSIVQENSIIISGYDNV